MNSINTLHSLLQQSATFLFAQSSKSFFKTDKGNYAHHDQFLGIRVPAIREIAKQFSKIIMPSEIEQLLHSKFNEERLLALFFLIDHYKRGNQTQREEIYQCYLKNISSVNNWNLVDQSAHLILGAHAFDTNNTSLLLQLAQANDLWQKRIAIVATLYFIRKNSFEITRDIAKILLNDTHDLIHKAVGWMLREMGKKNNGALISFLDEYTHQMPRTMLRYAIEKFPEDQRQFYLRKKNV